MHAFVFVTISAKFDPPSIQVIPKKYGCLRLNWNLSPDQAWLQACRSLNLEYRFKSVDSTQWNDPVSANQPLVDINGKCVFPNIWSSSYRHPNADIPSLKLHWICKNLCLYILCPWKTCQVFVQNAKTPVDMCHLLHWTRYFAQIRVRYQQSPWSEWSSSQSGVTLESGKPVINSDWHRQSVNHFPIYCLFFHFLLFSIYANVIFCICHYFLL